MMKPKTNISANKIYTISFPEALNIQEHILKLSTIPDLPSLPEGKTWLCIGGSITKHNNQHTSLLTFCQGRWSKDIFGPLKS